MSKRHFVQEAEGKRPGRNVGGKDENSYKQYVTKGELRFSFAAHLFCFHKS
jgi:hypothetical protein